MRRATIPIETTPKPTSITALGSGTVLAGTARVAESEIAPVPAGVWVKLMVKLAGAGLGVRAKVVVDQNRGAAQRTLDAINL